jgi:Ca2+-binding RTX toxin-like protein
VIEEDIRPRYVIPTGIEDTTFNTGPGQDVTQVWGGTNFHIVGSPDHDEVAIASTVGPVTVNTGDGSDTIYVLGTSAPLTVDGGPGDDIIHIHFQEGHVLGSVTVLDTDNTDTGEPGAVNGALSTTIATAAATAGDFIGISAAPVSPLIINGNVISQLGQTVILSPTIPLSAVSLDIPAGSPPPQVTNGAILFGDDLIIGGTQSDDTIVVNPGGNGSLISVILNGNKLGQFDPSRIIVYGYGGNDDITIAGGISLPSFLYGGDGNDRLKGGGGSNVLIGGDGDDLLVGGNSRDFLIGGNGSDRLVGNASDDILLGDNLSFTDDLTTLDAVMQEWNRTDRSYQDRIDDLKNGVLGTAQLNAITITTDSATDTLTGSAGSDWFISNPSLDRVTDLKDEIFMNDLTFILTP